MVLLTRIVLVMESCSEDLGDSCEVQQVKLLVQHNKDVDRVIRDRGVLGV